MALMSPGAPSLTTSQGERSPRRTRSRPRSSQSSWRSRWPSRTRDQYAFAVGRVAPRHQHALFLAARPRRQIDRVEEQGEELDVRQAPGTERRVPSAQLATDTAGGALGDLAQSSFLHQALDVAIGQSAHVAADDQRFQAVACG